MTKHAGGVLKTTRGTKSNHIGNKDENMAIPCKATIRRSTTLEELGMIQAGSNDSDDSKREISIESYFDMINDFDELGDSKKIKRRLRSFDSDDSLASCSSSTSNTTDSIERNDDEKSLDVVKYFSSREMTPSQEIMNALTMIPGVVYCLYFCLSGIWVRPTLVDNDIFVVSSVVDDSGLGCFDHWLIPKSLPSTPPLPVLAIAMGIVFHAPSSIIFHWKCATVLRNKPSIRSAHWSRRLDQSMIHFGSLCLTYATAGSVKYFLINLVYNMNCIYHQFKHGKIQPKKNQSRLAIALIAHTLPMLTRGHYMLFVQSVTILAISAWFFVCYPIGGWSHSIFHVVMFLLPPLLMEAACNLPESQSAIQFGAQCMAYASGRSAGDGYDGTINEIF